MAWLANLIKVTPNESSRVESNFCSREYENGLLFSISIVSTVLSIKTTQNLSPFSTDSRQKENFTLSTVKWAPCSYVSLTTKPPEIFGIACFSRSDNAFVVDSFIEVDDLQPYWRVPPSLQKLVRVFLRSSLMILSSTNNKFCFHFLSLCTL